MNEYTVIQDTREKEGWFFSAGGKCLGMETKTLPTGDYTLKGHEDVVCIERKASVTEIAGNLGKHKVPFQREMERMKDFPFSFIICEFSLSELINYPKNSKIPYYKQKQVRTSGTYLLKCLIEFQIWYNVKILFCDNKYNAYVVCDSVFRRLTELFNRDKNDNTRNNQ